MNKRGPRVLIWDLECSNLDADWGTLLTVGYKWLGEKKVHVLSAANYASWRKDPTDDSGITKDFLAVYNQADLTIAYNGVLFDKRWFMAKVLEHGLEIPPNIPMQDPLFAVKNLRISSASLLNALYYLRLTAEKTPVEKRIWRRAGVGHIPSLRYIVAHCKADVLALEELYLRVRPLMRTHFRLSDDLGACRYCNERRLQRRGRQVSKLKGAQVRVQCQACAGWDTRTIKEVEKHAIR